MANRDDGDGAILDGIFNVETGWHKGRGAKATGHGIDSFMKPTQAGAQTSSNVSQTPDWMQITPKAGSLFHATSHTASAANIELVKSLGADVAIDYKTQDFEKLLSGYDLVLNSQDPKTLEKSLSVLKPGGQLISISGPPDPAFARALGLNLILKLLFHLLSWRVRKKAERLNVGYSFLFMRADGQQLGQITSLLEAGVIRPVVDKVFPFLKTNDGLAYVETGRAKGKVVIEVV